MIAAVGSVLLTPWNWYSNDDAIHYTLGILGALIGPLFGILIAGYYLVSRQRVWVDDLFTMDPRGRYWFRNGYNPNAIRATAIAGLPAIASVVVPKLVLDLGVVHYDGTWIGNYSWFLGCGLGFLALVALERRQPMVGRLDSDLALATDGAGK
jgi:NCS1 family nucleobase:cation symporter-1